MISVDPLSKAGTTEWPPSDWCRRASAMLHSFHPRVRTQTLAKDLQEEYRQHMADCRSLSKKECTLNGCNQTCSEQYPQATMSLMGPSIHVDEAVCGNVDMVFTIPLLLEWNPCFVNGIQRVAELVMAIMSLDSPGRLSHRASSVLFTHIL